MNSSIIVGFSLNFSRINIKIFRIFPRSPRIRKMGENISHKYASIDKFVAIMADTSDVELAIVVMTSDDVVRTLADGDCVLGAALVATCVALVHAMVLLMTVLANDDIDETVDGISDEKMFVIFVIISVVIDFILSMSMFGSVISSALFIN